MNNNYNFALTAALNETGLDKSEIRCVNMEKEDGLFYITFRTDWQKYECYVDAGTFQVLGLNFMPYTEDFSDNLEYVVASTVA